jgi:hypothetical protein
MPKILSVIVSKDTKYCVYNKYHRKLEVYVYLLSRRSQREVREVTGPMRGLD